MAQNTASCRVCGKAFIPCGKSSAEIGAFNYREVACSQECGQEYLKRVLAARSLKITPTDIVEETESVVRNETPENEANIEVLENTDE